MKEFANFVIKYIVYSCIFAGSFMFFRAYSEHKESTSIYSKSSDSEAPQTPISTASKPYRSEPKQPISQQPANMDIYGVSLSEPLTKKTSAQVADKIPVKKIMHDSDLILLSDLIEE